jgi:hypothetical protein
MKKTNRGYSFKKREIGKIILVMLMKTEEKKGD